MDFLANLTRRSVSYRSLFFFRFAIAITCLWVIHDFYVINQTKIDDEAFRHLVPPPSFETDLLPNPAWNQWLGTQFTTLTNPLVFQWLLLGSILLAVGFALGRMSRVCAAGLSFFMVLCGACAPLFQSAADSWLFWVLFLALWAPADPPLTARQWRENPTIESRYAALVVFLSFTVYFFAGCSKLALGGHQWLGGTALQNIAFDPSIREPFRGMLVPHWISLLLCYFTLFQRLIVPFFFYLGRPWQIASIIILGSMHFGYNALMYVSIFPCMGLASLMLVLTAPPPPHPSPASRLAWLWRIPATTAIVLLAVLPALQVVSKCSNRCLYMSQSLPRWSFAFYYPLRWEMFASGGTRDQDKWQFLIVKNHKEVIDATHLIDRHLPPLWRTRFYRDALDRDAYSLWLMPQASIKHTELPFQLYALITENVYLSEGGKDALFITDSHIRFENGDEKIFR